MINNFGQTPCQLLKEPHPQRLSLNKASLRMLDWNYKKPDLTLFFDQLAPFQVKVTRERGTCKYNIHVIETFQRSKCLH